MKMRWMVERMRKDNTGMKRGMEQLKGWNGIKKKRKKRKKWRSPCERGAIVVAFFCNHLNAFLGIN